jgi:hypothetical protein
MFLKQRIEIAFASTKFAPALKRKFGRFGVALQSLLHCAPNLSPELRMDRDRGEFRPRILIKKLQSRLPRVNDSRFIMNTLFVKKLWSPVDHFHRKMVGAFGRR